MERTDDLRRNTRREIIALLELFGDVPRLIDRLDATEVICEWRARFQSPRGWLGEVFAADSLVALDEFDAALNDLVARGGFRSTSALIRTARGAELPAKAREALAVIGAETAG